MSSSAIFTAAEVIKSLKQGHITTCCHIAVAALVVYEHIITFDREVLAIWRYRMTGATILLLSNRYMLLSIAICNVLGTLIGTSQQDCDTQLVSYDVTYVSTIVIAAAFSALRVYAITERNWCWAFLVLLMGLVPAATNIYVYTSASHIYVIFLAGMPECAQTTTLSHSIFNRLAIATRICAIVSDLVVVVATWSYARPWAKRASDTQIKTPLMRLIVRDGTGYFIVLLILNITQMALEQLSYSAPETFQIDYITVFLSTISPILISRFIFNLRQHVDEGNGTGLNDPSFVAGDMGSRGSIEFGSRLVGNMGAPLDHSIPDSLLFDVDDEPHGDIGFNDELATE